MNPINKLSSWPYWLLTAAAALGAVIFAVRGHGPEMMVSLAVFFGLLFFRSEVAKSNDTGQAAANRQFVADIPKKINRKYQKITQKNKQNHYGEVGAIGNLGRLRRPTNQRASGRQRGGVAGRKKQTKSSASDDSDGGGGEPPAQQKPRKILVVHFLGVCR